VNGKRLKVATSEIIAIGNEILIGKTLDTNTNWLAKRLTELGVYVKRALIVRDDVKDVSEAVNLSTKSATFVITTGGLGPTEDDLTLRALSKAFQRKLELNGNALKMVKQRYECLYRQGVVDSIELTPARKKMATLPQESLPVFNPVGAAPGVLIEHNHILVLALPGVPKEMYAVFENIIGDVIARIGQLRSVEIREITTNFRDESRLAPILKSAQHEVSGIFLKSLATHFGKEVRMKVRIMAYGENRMNKIETVIRLLKEKYEVQILRD